MLSSASIRPNAARVESTTACAAARLGRGPCRWTSVLAPAAFTASAVWSRMRAIARHQKPRPKNRRARRTAVARPMTWLAPVTMATDGGPLRMVMLSGRGFRAQENRGSRRRSRRAWVSSAKWPVSKKRSPASGMSRLKASAPGGEEEGVVRAPDRQERRLVGAEIGLECRIERDVALVVAEEVELNLVRARARQIVVVERRSRPATPASGRARRGCTARRSSGA